uniref:DUF8040 domain-containing protein n=1 Tax=Lactuca sativa TaxID=4236 RepID=A0A9R1V445_LACSA|nr:hypothetical protein LSAT_V11C700374580 [Lactuca sativa]
MAMLVSSWVDKISKLLLPSFDMDRNHLLQFMKLLESCIQLLMCLTTIRLWLIECEEKEAQMRALSKSTLENRLDTILKRSIEIQHITRESDENCINELHMDRNAFAHLCELLHTRGGLLDNDLVTIEEQHTTKNRCIQVRFYRSGETVSRYVHRVLGELMHIQEILFVKPTPIANDCTDNRWKWFMEPLMELILKLMSLTRINHGTEQERLVGKVRLRIQGFCGMQLLDIMD